jgi:CRP-like cAMP-binding protein
MSRVTKMHEPLRSFIQKTLPQFTIDWALVEPLLQIKNLRKGEFLFQEGDTCDFVGLVLKGYLRMFFLKDGKELTLFFHPENYACGDYQNFRLQRSTCFSCQAIEDSEVLILDRQVIQVLESAPDGQQLLRLTVECLAFQLRGRLLSLYRDAPEQRYLHLIETESKLLQQVPQHYLASYLGIEPESFSRLKRRVYQRRIS